MGLRAPCVEKMLLDEEIRHRGLVVKGETSERHLKQ